MYWSDAEILKQYSEANGKREQKKTIQLLAELNGVPVDVMSQYIDGLNVSHETQKQETVKTKKKPGAKPKSVKADRLVYEAVLLRAVEVEANMNAITEQIKELENQNKKYLEEWGILSEWMKANEP